jgi:hypothetical protein
VVVGDGELATFDEAKRSQCWIKAMKEGMASIQQNDTWKLVKLPLGHKAIGLKWVFKVKRDEGGAIIKHKARLVAKGYVQKKGINFDEVYAPVAETKGSRFSFFWVFDLSVYSNRCLTRICTYTYLNLYIGI